jgi:head-tail adaptor
MGKLQLGKLQHRISFYRDATVIDPATGEQTNQVQTIKENRWGSVKYIGSPSAGSSEEELNEQRTGKIKIEVVTRFFSGLRFEDWISYEGGKFRIYSIQTLGRNEGYSLRAELRDDDTPALPTGAILDASAQLPAATLVPAVSISDVDGLQAALDLNLETTDTGYEFTGGFTDRTTGQSGANDIGSNVQYTSTMAADETWYRFGFSTARQVANDVAYFPVDDPTFDQTKGLFGGIHMPEGIDKLIDFSNTDLEAAVTTGDLKYTEAAGSYWLEDCNVGDLVKIRFSFNAVPQVANSTLEVGLIFATRNDDGDVTFTFPLPTQPIFYGTGTQGQAYLNRVEMSAYIASDEDRQARLLPAIRCNNEILIQPLTTLISIVR